MLTENVNFELFLLMAASRPRRTVQPVRRYGFSEESEDDISQSDSQEEALSVSSDDEEQELDLPVISPAAPAVPFDGNDQWQNVNAGMTLDLLLFNIKTTKAGKALTLRTSALTIIYHTFYPRSYFSYCVTAVTAQTPEQSLTTQNGRWSALKK